MRNPAPGSRIEAAQRFGIDLTFDGVKECSEAVAAFDRTVWTLNLASLIRAKRAAGREKDLLILPEREALLEAQEAKN